MRPARAGLGRAYGHKISKPVLITAGRTAVPAAEETRAKHPPSQMGALHARVPLGSLASGQFSLSCLPDHRS